MKKKGTANNRAIMVFGAFLRRVLYDRPTFDSFTYILVLVS